jgi:hypothetical protein
VARTTGSKTWATFTPLLPVTEMPLGNSLGLVTTISSPASVITR